MADPEATPDPWFTLDPRFGIRMLPSPEPIVFEAPPTEAGVTLEPPADG